jgi:lysozyme
MKAKIIGGSVAAVLAVSIGVIKPWESPGGEPQLQPYVDLVGVRTVCFGETNVPMRTYTRAECERLLSTDVAKRLQAMDHCIDRPLTVNQYAAVLSWSYNVGTTAACGSSLVRKINAGAAPEQWCPELLRWNKAGGRVIKGLTNRRQAELRLCLRKD